MTLPIISSNFNSQYSRWLLKMVSNGLPKIQHTLKVMRMMAPQLLDHGEPTKLLSTSLRKTNNFYDVTTIEVSSTLINYFFELSCSHFIFSNFLFPLHIFLVLALTLFFLFQEACKFLFNLHVF